MNLQEQISRIKTIMGVIKEEVDDACKLKNINLNTLQSYWEDKSKTEQKKITEVENFVKPFFTEAKTYMLKYIESEWFNKKVQEKIGKGSKYNTEDLEKYKKQVINWQNKVNGLKNANISELQRAKETLEFFNDMVKKEEVKLKGVITIWDNEQKNELKNFLNSVNLVFSLTCDDSTGGFVIKGEYSKLNFCVKNVFPSDVNKNSIMLILVHEFNHCLSGYFISKGVDYLPEDAKGPQVSVSTETNYGNTSNENASRVQNLKRLLGVDDFGTLDNFIKLIKDNVKIKSGDNVFNVVYENNLMKIPFKSAEDITLLDFKLFINDTDAYDVKLFFNTESKTVRDEYDSYIEVDLNKLYNYSQEFAKIDTTRDVNYT
jgi:hypothetical protein